ncbi:undecaprenyldiphospho-muramoylpentapeptide beta-N-acetylglucosaminyltransferase [candidate division KSB1 bacterium]|nr:undecaprenyldiphospho-muramoylpentapeptide beta-N-acetylglucosaminyltransferase [candidate division KSB1 bacterium]
MARSNSYIFAGGGTGGHLYPAVALAQRLVELRPECAVQFVGTARGIERRVLPELGFPLSLIAVRGVDRSLTLRNLLVPFTLSWSLLQCCALLLKYRPNAVIGTGGYVSGPMLFVASLLRIPTLIQEQNSVPGATTRLLARLVRRIHISFAESRRYFKKQRNLHLSGNPVRQFDLSKSRDEACAQFGLTGDHPVCLVFGGSQGAQAINAALLNCLDELMGATSLQIIWSAGQHDLEGVKELSARYADRISVAAFISDMASAYAAADFCLTRAGALTLAELTLVGLPSIIVPYPYAAGNHQETNARALERQHACVLIRQSELPDKLLAELLTLASDDEKRQRLAEAARASSFPNATDEIVQSIFEIER